jgi:hypothetical protein
VARACARVDSGLDKAKICSDRRVEADRPQLRTVFGGGKTVFAQPGPIAEVSLSARFRLQQSPLFRASCDELYVTAMLLFCLLASLRKYQSIGRFCIAVRIKKE